MSQTIMLVEDETDIREAVAALLRFEGLRVIEAANGREALAYLEAGDVPTLCICDINMPVMGGTDFIRHALIKYPHLSVVMLSAYSDKERIIEALRLGALDYLVKPFVPQELILNLNTLLDIAWHRRQLTNSQLASEQRESIEKMTTLQRIKHSLKKVG